MAVCGHKWVRQPDGSVTDGDAAKPGAYCIACKAPIGGSPPNHDRARLQVRCSKDQERMLQGLAAADGSSLSAWCLAQLMAAVDKKDRADSVVLVLDGNLADRVRKKAAAQGITPEQLMSQLVIASLR